MKSKYVQRFSLSVAFFLSGLNFATWASRIPTIKEFFEYNEAELGNILLVLPVSSLIGLPISGWLVSNFESRKPLLMASILSSFALIFIGYTSQTITLIIAVSLFAFFLRIQIISMNTQAITLQNFYNKSINGSFHGLWSAGGIFGILFSTLLIKLNISMGVHLTIIGVFTFLVIFISYPYFLSQDKALNGNRIKFGKPDSFILYLGILVFLASICEGGMYDWSGLYFKEVIKEELFTLGYLAFVISMTISRFGSDYLVEYMGISKTYIFSSILITLGFLITIIFPYFWPAMFGFISVGFGVASIVPITYTLAGASKKYSAGMSISIISTYGMVGVFLGPPLIGYLAHSFGLKKSFALFILFGLMVVPVSKLFFSKYKKK